MLRKQFRWISAHAKFAGVLSIEKRLGVATRSTPGTTWLIFNNFIPCPRWHKGGTSTSEAKVCRSDSGSRRPLLTGGGQFAGRRRLAVTRLVATPDLV